MSIRTGTTRARDLIAAAATYGGRTYAELARLVHDASTDDARRELAGTLDLRVIARLARTVARTARDDDDRADALALFELVAVVGGRAALQDRETLDFLELLALDGRTEALKHYVRTLRTADSTHRQGQLLVANSLRRRHDRTGREFEAATRALKAVLTDAGLEPPVVGGGAGSAFERLECSPTSRVDSGPLVSVVASADGPWTPGGARTLLEQSYRNVEIIVVRQVPALPRRSPWAVADPRIRHIRVEDEAGPTEARRLAIARAASGTYVTFHHPGTWLHPRAVERQVDYLENHPERVGCIAPAVHATDDLYFVGSGENLGFIGPERDTMMLRREHPVLAGGWDRTERYSDAELAGRVKALTGLAIGVVGKAPTRIIRSDRSPDRPVAFDQDRRWYAESFQHWHATAPASALEAGPSAGGSRPFSAPIMLLPRHRRPHHVDVVYATDFRFPGGNTSLARNEITALLDAGHRVALLQLDSAVPKHGLRIDPRILDVAVRPGAEIVSSATELAADLTVVRHPTVLQFAEPQRCAITTRRLVQIVNHPPHDADGSNPMYDMSTVVTTAEAMFGVTPQVAPESKVIRKLLEGLVAPGLLTENDWHGILPSAPAEPRDAAPDRPPVIGRHSRDGFEKWPDAEVLQEVYPVDGSRDIRVLGGATQASRRTGLDVDNAWTVYPFGSHAPSEFLNELDFWVYFHGPELFESFGMATVEALHAGLVVVLPHYMEPTFGDAAVYASPHDALSVVDRLWADPDAYRAQSSRAIRRAGEWFGPAALLHRVTDLGVRPSDAMSRTERASRWSISHLWRARKQQAQ
ncbi:glycosyltransferase [Myceligenerans salitolerans]|uniref:Glycosyltransferase 2-like domain-containing protein n=1 Tax=Myceligenerans salitolerans TaxID=1230528 RepID=A0ABS3I845_9MICO|nr:glycosyltransferase [Myceligenerans salitolerans]MBO0609168.1 hypothetical protein [Myceligenerans salitolerans]